MRVLAGLNESRHPQSPDTVPDARGMLEVVTLARQDNELVIHAMAMRPKYRRLMLGD